MIRPDSVDWIRATEAVGGSYRILSDTEAQEIRWQAEEKYGKGKHGVYSLWDFMPTYNARYYPDGWRRIDEFLDGSDYIVFFDNEQDPRHNSQMVEMVGGTSLEKVYAESSEPVIYVTDRETSYLLCQTDHEILMGAGAAAEWRVLARDGSGEFVESIDV